MPRWLKAHPFTSMFGISLSAFYLVALLEPPSLGLFRILIVPAYLFRALTGSVLHILIPDIFGLFWFKELALLTAYFTPLLVIDVVAVHFSRNWHPVDIRGSLRAA